MEEKKETFIEVSDGCIIGGVKHHCGQCPVALAILAKVKNGVRVSVHEGTISFSDDCHSYSHWTPSAVVDFIRNFDSGNPVSPITFSLNIPTRFLKT